MWCDGYDNNEVTIVNDLRKGTFTFSYLLELLDRYPFQVEVKGGYRQFLSKVVVITCSKNHKDLWGEIAGRENEHLDQLTRRITEEFKFPATMDTKMSLLRRMRQAVLDVSYEPDNVFGEWNGKDPVP